MNTALPTPEQIVFALRVGWRLRRWHHKHGALLEEDGGRGRRSFEIPPETVAGMTKGKVLRAEPSSRNEPKRFTDFVLRIDGPKDSLFQ